MKTIQQYVRLCDCGCEQPTTIPIYTDRSKGWMSGIPLPRCNGHQKCTAWQYTVNERGCWISVKPPCKNGYIRSTYKGHSIAVHRYNYESKYGPVPKGLDLDHLCRNRACINPDHLEPVTRSVNSQRGAMAVLNAELVHRIRKLRDDGGTHRGIAAQIGVSKGCVTSVLTFGRWGNV